MAEIKSIFDSLEIQTKLRVFGQEGFRHVIGKE